MKTLDTLYLYGRYLSVSIRGQMQYRASFVMLALGHMVTTGWRRRAAAAGPRHKSQPR